MGREIYNPSSTTILWLRILPILEAVEKVTLVKIWGLYIAKIIPLCSLIFLIQFFVNILLEGPVPATFNKHYSSQPISLT